MIEKNRIDKFWCSALIGYIYVKLGFLNEKIKWTLLTPNNFSSHNKNSELVFINCNLNNDASLSSDV